VNIESGIPIPPKRRGHGKRRTVFSAGIRAMAIGNSYLFDDVRELDRARKIMKRAGFRYEQRKSCEGWRIWRVA
jgi:biotin synthase-like enzyme